MAQYDPSDDWRGAEGTHHIVDAEGRTLTVEERFQGLRFTNELGQSWFLPHVAGDTDDPNVVWISGVKFRRDPG